MTKKKGNQSTSQQKGGNGNAVKQGAPAPQPGKPKNVYQQTKANQKPIKRDIPEKHKAFFENMVNPSCAFMLPRIIPTEAAPHFYQTSMSIPVGDDSSRTGAFMISPSLKYPLAVLKKTAEADRYENPQRINDIWVESVWSETDIDFSLPLVSPDRTIIPTASSKGNYMNVEDQVVKSGGRYYEGKGITIPDNTSYLSVHNDNTSSKIYQAYVENVHSDGTRSGRVEGPQTTITSLNNGNLKLGPFTQDADPSVVGVAFGLRTIVSTGASRFDVFLQGGLNIGSAWAWEPLPFFSDNRDAVMTDFFAAEKYSITAFSSLISNTSSEMWKGGSIRAAQLPGGSRYQLPTTPEEIYKFIGNVNTIHCLKSLQLKDGAFWSYHPEKIQDVMFRKHPKADEEFLYADRELPYFVCAFKWPNEDQVPQLNLEAKICLEYLTNSLVAAKFTSPVDTTRLMELWFMLGNCENHVSHNPNHLDAAKRMAKTILDRTLLNKEFRQAAFAAGMTLGKVALGVI